MGGKERRLLKFSCMDYEAAAEDFGTQVGLFEGGDYLGPNCFRPTFKKKM